MIAIQEIHHHDTRRTTHFYVSHCVSTKFGINGILPHAIKCTILYHYLLFTNVSINKFNLRASDYYFSKFLKINLCHIFFSNMFRSLITT
ncbi:hypothetical protein C0J52_14721 [Blattella germanica]|nr:hypothetical protein C0J52_14721 [Blattella germanica]